jgi:hypothetical protein
MWIFIPLGIIYMISLIKFLAKLHIEIPVFFRFFVTAFPLFIINFISLHLADIIVNYLRKETSKNRI